MFSNFFNSISAYGQALRLIPKLGLWGYFLVPALCGLLVLGVFGTAAWALSDNIAAWVLSFYPWEAGEQVLDTVGTILSGILIFTPALILYKHFVLIVSAPFMSPLSERIEGYLTGVPKASHFSGSQMVKDMVRGARIALRNIIREVLLTLGILLLGIVPGVNLLVPVLLFLVQSYYAGFGNMDFTLERHTKVRESVRFVKDNRGIALGNGVIFMGLLTLGIGFLIAPPLATIAATIETTKKLDIPPPVSEAYV